MISFSSLYNIRTILIRFDYVVYLFQNISIYGLNGYKITLFMVSGDVRTWHFNLKALPFENLRYGKFMKWIILLHQNNQEVEYKYKPHDNKEVQLFKRSELRIYIIYCSITPKRNNIVSKNRPGIKKQVRRAIAIEQYLDGIFGKLLVKRTFGTLKINVKNRYKVLMGG